MRQRVVAIIGGVVTALALVVPGPAAGTELPSFDLAAALALADIEAPPSGVGLIATLDFAAEAPLVLDGVPYNALSLDITPDGDVVTRNAVTAGGVESSEAGVSECEDPAFKPVGVKWAKNTMPILWRLNLRSIPNDLVREKTKLTIRSAHRIWPQSKTNCEGDDEIAFSYNYLGHTRKHPKYDRVNMVDFGPVNGGALAINYTWYRGSDIVEVDLRLSSGYAWTNVQGVKNRYQVKNVVAHELGHQFGLDDLSDPHAGLTMYAVTGRGEMSKATLGFGDLKGARSLSP